MSLHIKKWPYERTPIDGVVSWFPVQLIGPHLMSGPRGPATYTVYVNDAGSLDERAWGEITVPRDAAGYIYGGSMVLKAQVVLNADGSADLIGLVIGDNMYPVNPA